MSEVKRVAQKSIRPGAADEDQSQAIGRRRVPRRPIENRVGLLHKGQYHIVWGFELGEGGLLISSPIVLADGDRVVLTLRIPEVLQGVITGTVVYGIKKNSDEARYGVRFDDIDFETKRKIRNFVASARTYAI